MTSELARAVVEMIIALAAPRVATSLEDGLERVRRLVEGAAAAGAGIVCFPEAYLPGLRGLDFDVPAFDERDRDAVLDAVSEMARRGRIGVVLGFEWPTTAGREIVAAVFDEEGRFLGRQSKCQLDPSEEPTYVPGSGRRVFEIGGLRFGIAICHEGFRYPETVRWAAREGAVVVFHPHCTGSDRTGVTPNTWGAVDGAYYEKAVMCRALENTIYVASVNYAFRFPESATCLIGPSGECEGHLPYGEEGLLVRELEPAAATGLLAQRFAPDRCRSPSE